MESANLHLPADQFVGSPPNLAAPSCFGYGSNLAATWSSSSTPTTTLSTNIVTSDGIISNSSTRRKSTDHHQNHDHHNNILVSEIQHNPLNSTSTTSCNLVQDLGFLSHHQSAYSNEQLSRIKEEFSEISFPKFTELLMNSPSNSNVDVHGNFLFKADHNFRDLSYCSSSSSSNNSTGTEHHQSPLMVKSFSSSCQINAPEFDHSNGTTTATSGFGGLAVQGCRGQFSQIYPTVNISNSSQYSLMGMNLKPGFDHLAGSTRFYNSQPNLSNFGVDPIQQQHRLSCSGHSKTISSFNSEITEAKRPGSLMEPKMSTQNKKSRLESRTPCPPFKVRKEKLGDRIAALQQLVSPFGKTDTASVLMEAIGYINFLQNQVETLSVPYMKTGNKSTKTMQGGQKDQDGNIKGEEQRDLKSRGLCLVPLSCMSYVTGDGGGGSIWPPVPNFSTGRIT